MAPGKPNGNGREQFEGTLGGQKISFAVRDLLSILLLVGTFALGYVIWTQLSYGLRLLHGQHREIERMLDQQNELVHAQTKEMIHFFFALDYNAGRPPQERIPLRLYVEQKERQESVTPEQREERVRQQIQQQDDPTSPLK
jgi:hypothetical protein